MRETWANLLVGILAACIFEATEPATLVDGGSRGWSAAVGAETVPWKGIPCSCSCPCSCDQVVQRSRTISFVRLRGGRAGKKRREMKQKESSTAAPPPGPSVVEQAVAMVMQQKEEQASTRAAADEYGMGDAGQANGGSMESSRNGTDPERRRREKEAKRQMYQDGLRAYVRHANWAFRKALAIRREEKAADKQRLRSIRASLLLAKRVHDCLPADRRIPGVLPPILVPRAVQLRRAGWEYRGPRGGQFRLGISWNGNLWAPKDHPITKRISRRRTAGGAPKRYSLWLVPSLRPSGGIPGGGLRLEELAERTGGGPSAHIPLLEGLLSGDPSLLLRRAANAIYGNACFIVPNPRVRIRRGSAGSPTEVYVDAIPQGSTQVMRGAIAEAVGDCASLPAATNGAMRLVLRYSRDENYAQRSLQAIQDEVDSLLRAGQVFECDTLTLYRTEGPVTSWFSTASAALKN